MTKVENVEEFLKEQKLRWVGHVKRIDHEKAPAKAKIIVVKGSKKGRPKKRWEKVVEKNHTG